MQIRWNKSDVTDGHRDITGTVVAKRLLFRSRKKDILTETFKIRVILHLIHL